jgi:hypothetical protein
VTLGIPDRRPMRCDEILRRLMERYAIRRGTFSAIDQCCRIPFLPVCRAGPGVLNTFILCCSEVRGMIRADSRWITQRGSCFNCQNLRQGREFLAPTFRTPTISTRVGGLSRHPRLPLENPAEIPFQQVESSVG